jgi:hypothetical protein
MGIGLAEILSQLLFRIMLVPAAIGGWALWMVPKRRNRNHDHKAGM